MNNSQRDVCFTDQSGSGGRGWFPLRNMNVPKDALQQTADTLIQMSRICEIRTSARFPAQCARCDRCGPKCSLPLTSFSSSRIEVQLWKRTIREFNVTKCNVVFCLTFKVRCPVLGLVHLFKPLTPFKVYGSLIHYWVVSCQCVLYL